VPEDIQAIFLAVDESMPFDFVIGMSASHGSSLLFKGIDQTLFHLCLGFFTFLIGGKT
jgi:hypothetical protein